MMPGNHHNQLDDADNKDEEGKVTFPHLGDYCVHDKTSFTKFYFYN